MTDQAELDAELTSTRRWLEARRSLQGTSARAGGDPGLPYASEASERANGGEPGLRHTAEPVWNADLPPHSEPGPAPTDEHEEEGTVPGVNGWRTPGARKLAAIAIVVGAALLTMMVRSSSGRPPQAHTAGETVAPAVVPAPALVDNDIPALSVVDDPALPVDTDALRREARQLLSEGKVQSGVRIARQLIEADPRDSEAYILLAAGLQDLGRWRESQQLFDKCAHLASGADTAECVYFARRAQ